MKLNVLVVDDSRTARAIIIKTLGMTELEGMEWGEIHEAGNGREALDSLSEHWIDLIFTDIHMPEMDGIEFVEHLSEDGVLQNTPVIVTSTEGNRERIEGLQHKGVRAYLRKPFMPEDLCEALQKIYGD